MGSRRVRGACGGKFEGALVLWAGLALAGCPEDGALPGEDADVPDEPEAADASHAGGEHDAGALEEEVDAAAPAAPAPPSAPSAPAQRAEAHFFLPTLAPKNTANPRLAIDADDRTHLVYPAYAQPLAYYGVCTSDCASADDLKLVEFALDGTVRNAQVALTPAGAPRVLLTTGLSVYYAQCDAGCEREDSWTLAQIVDHAGDYDVTGESFALDPTGRPRFLTHTTRAFNGIGQKPPQTLYARCDAACDDAASWSFDVIDPDSMFEGASLRFDARGVAHVASAVVTTTGSFPATSVSTFAYYQCSAGCDMQAAWHGAEFGTPVGDLSKLVRMTPAISLALTADGKPRMAALTKNQANTTSLVYVACEDDCSAQFGARELSADPGLAQGLDLALDAQGHPRIAFNLDYDIALLRCDDAACGTKDAAWSLDAVERTRDIPKDTIILRESCSVSGWFMHDPSLVIGSDGAVRVGYQMRDVAGGNAPNPDPSKPRCTAGTELTWARFTQR